jgi:hypothetical protein
MGGVAGALHVGDVADRDKPIAREARVAAESDPLVVYHVMRAIFRVVHGILHRMALQANELTNYIFKQHGKY